jgi:hypothetical protein
MERAWGGGGARVVNRDGSWGVGPLYTADGRLGVGLCILVMAVGALDLCILLMAVGVLDLCILLMAAGVLDLCILLTGSVLSLCHRNWNFYVIFRHVLTIPVSALDWLLLLSTQGSIHLTAVYASS